MKDKPTILIIDKHRRRSPLLSQYYDYISRPDGPFNIIRDERVDLPAEKIIQDRLKGSNPDYICWGFNAIERIVVGGKSAMKSADFINSNHIGTIIDIGDIQQFTLQPNINRNFRDINVKFVTVRWKKLDNYSLSKKLQTFMNKQKWLKNAEIIYIPWSIDPNTYKDRKLKRDIDVSLICSIFNQYHKKRNIAKRILYNMKDKINVKIGNIWGDEYINTLFRTKIFIVEGTGRDAMVQKYIEGPACGAMLLGEIPSTARHILVDKISMVEVKDYTNIDKYIMHYLIHGDERERIAKEGRRRIFDCCVLDKATKDFENIILNDYRSNK